MRRWYVACNFAMPNVVFWNLRVSARGAQFPITMDEAGTPLTLGFSAALLNLFMDGEEIESDKCAPACYCAVRGQGAGVGGLK